MPAVLCVQASSANLLMSSPRALVAAASRKTEQWSSAPGPFCASLMQVLCTWDCKPACPSRYNHDSLQEETIEYLWTRQHKRWLVSA